MDKVSQEAGIYTNVQELSQLRGEYKLHPEIAKNQVAKQFESMLMQMVLHSMREANQAFASDLFGSNDMDTYQDMFDKQLSMLSSTPGQGFTADIKKSIDEQERLSGHQTSISTEKPIEPKTVATQHVTPSSQPQTAFLPIMQPVAEAEKEMPQVMSDKESFIRMLLPAAKKAAQLIGGNPALLLAQAALETNWGKNILSNKDQSSTHNLFNIKSDPAWHDKSTMVDTMEQKDGLLVKIKAHFRSYTSYYNSFMDYVNFLKSNSRYSGAINNAANPATYIHELQTAGFATDTDYSNKVMKIFNSHTFRELIAKFE